MKSKPTSEASALAEAASLRELVACAGDWVWECDAQGRLSGLRGEAAARLWPFEEWVGRADWEIPGALEQPADWAAHRQRFDQRRPFADLLVERARTDRSRGVVQLCGVPRFAADGAFLGYVGIGRDLTDLHRAQDTLQRLAAIDPLTRLLNRQSFDEQAQKALADCYAHGRQCALLCIGIDQFDVLNGMYGRRVGDRVLAAAAERLQQWVAAPGILGRRDGAEIVALFIDLPDAEEAMRLAQTASDIVGAPQLVGSVRVAPRVSVGAGVFPRDGGDLDALLAAADAALLQVRSAGGGIARFSAELARRAEVRSRLEEHLLRGSGARDFRLVYQPMVSLPDGALVGAEALLRWKDGELGDIGPDEFIPIAEESGLIEGVGEWVLREACRQRKLWRQVGLELPPLSINVSAVQLRRRDFVDGVLAALDEFDGSAEELEIEITETGLMDCSREAQASLQRLRDAGIRTALDDFGVGYSSLVHLRDLPMYRLKIDRSFTAECMRDARTLTIVKSVIDMAHNLGLTVTAEGIETPEQQDWMHQLGCDSGQGYYFARPMPAEDFLQRFLDARTRAGTPAAPSSS